MFHVKHLRYTGSMDELFPNKPSASKLRKLGVQFDPYILLDEEDRPHKITELYHGSPAHLEEGAEIVAQPWSRRKLAYAAPEWHTAVVHASDMDPDTNELKMGNVYAVEPIDKEDRNSTWVQPMKFSRRGTREVVSTKGFRVLKKVYPN